MMIAGLVDGELRKNLFVLGRVDLLAPRESARGWRRFRGYPPPRVAKPARVATLERLFEMWPAAEDERVRHGQHRLHKHLQLSAADQAVVVGRILAQVEAEVFGLFGLDDLARRVPHLRLHAAAADGARPWSHPRAPAVWRSRSWGSSRALPRWWPARTSAPGCAGAPISSKTSIRCDYNVRGRRAAARHGADTLSGAGRGRWRGLRRRPWRG